MGQQTEEKLEPTGKILFIGSEEQNKIFKERTSDVVDFVEIAEAIDIDMDLNQYHLIVDLTFSGRYKEKVNFYNEKAYKGFVICDMQTNSLLNLNYESNVRTNFSLFSTLSQPYFLGRPEWEICYLDKQNVIHLSEFLANFSIGTNFVEDQVGGVTLRVLSMLINESYFMLQEGVAEKEAIDTALKLGTNYPFGPFEWLDIIGIDVVGGVLDHLGKTLSGETYKISPLLRKEYLSA